MSFFQVSNRFSWSALRFHSSIAPKKVGTSSCVASPTNNPIKNQAKNKPTFHDSIQDLIHKAQNGALLSSQLYVNGLSNQQLYKATTTASRPVVTLLHPPGACSAFTRSGSLYPPLGLHQLSAVIGDESIVHVLEGDGNQWTNEETAMRILQASPQAVGMTVTCGTKPLVHAWSTVVKQLKHHHRHHDVPQIGLETQLLYDPIVIVGGPAAAFETPSIFKSCPNVDVVVKGEGEVVFPEIVNILQDNDNNISLDKETKLQLLSKLPGVNVRGYPESNDKKILNVPKESFAKLPFPDLLSSTAIKNYRAPDAQRSPMITMMTQRGCIAKCAFCNTPQIHGSQIRGWTNEQVVEELMTLKKIHGIREVSFVDDVFTNRKGGPRKLCQLMIAAKLDLTWYCNARADQITKSMALAMKLAGCHQVFLGFESGCDDMLKRIEKGETVAQLERGAKLLKDVGINISIGFIIGLPGETQKSVDKTIALANRVQPHRVQFTRYTPIPGSKLAAGTSSLASHDSNDNIINNDNESKKYGFHNRSGGDQIEEWIQQCYDQCVFKPSV